MTLTRNRPFGRLAWPRPALLAAYAVAAAIVDPASDAEKPNIVFILIDDLGWMDLHCQGNKRIDTPNIDRLAAWGSRRGGWPTSCGSAC